MHFQKMGKMLGHRNLILKNETNEIEEHMKGNSFLRGGGRRSTESIEGSVITSDVPEQQHTDTNTHKHQSYITHTEYAAGYSRNAVLHCRDWADVKTSLVLPQTHTIRGVHGIHIVIQTSEIPTQTHINKCPASQILLRHQKGFWTENKLRTQRHRKQRRLLRPDLPFQTPTTHRQCQCEYRTYTQPDH